MKTTNKQIKDNYKITEYMERTPDNLLVAGHAATSGITKSVELLEISEKLETTKQIQYTKATWLLEAATVLGRSEASFFLSFIYSEGGALMENEKLSTLWLAVGCELKDERAVKAFARREEGFDEKTKVIAKRYADYMKSAAKIYDLYSLVSLEQIEGAIAAWNSADWEHNLDLTPHTIELAEECGALQEVPALMGDTNQSCCIIM